MNTKQMDYIIEVAQTLNFHRAAENLFISQPALSYQIKTVEEELGFHIFDRIGKSIRLTPAGADFVRNLQQIRQQLLTSIEQGQNFSSRYSDNITISYPRRSCLHFLPQAIEEYRELHPEVQITPDISQRELIEEFNQGKSDILFVSRDDASKIPDAIVHPLYTSKIYLLVANDDPLSKHKKATSTDLQGRTLLINGGSSLTLRSLQKEVLSQVRDIQTLNSPTHDFTMVAVQSHTAVCLSPGYLNDFTNQVTWVPFETDKAFNCVLVTHKYDKRENLQDFILLLQDIYQDKANSQHQ